MHCQQRSQSSSMFTTHAVSDSRRILRYFDGGHFVLDEYADAIARAIIETFSGQDRRAMRPAV